MMLKHMEIRKNISKMIKNIEWTYSEMLHRIYSRIEGVSQTENNFRKNLKRYLRDIEVDLLLQYEIEKKNGYTQTRLKEIENSK
jgi:hypothetical protein